MTKGSRRDRAEKKHGAFQPKEETPHRKKSTGATKAWLIEVKFPILYCGKDWSRWGAYETEKQRDQAYETLKNKVRNPGLRYRKAYRGEKE